MRNKYSIGFCLRGDTYFETDHPEYNMRKKALYANVTEILKLIDLCVDSDCEVYINIPIKRKFFFQTRHWREFKVQGMDGNRYTISYTNHDVCEKKGVSIHEVEEEIKNLKSDCYKFQENNWERRSF